MKLSSKNMSVLGILLFVLIVSRIDFTETIGKIIKINPFFIILCLTTVAVEIILRSLRWMILVNQYLKDYRLIDSIQTFMMGVAFGAVTPGRVGDIVKAFDIRDRGIEIDRSLSIEIIDRLIDMLFILIAALMGYLFITIVILGFGYNKILVALIFILVLSFTVIMFSTSSLAVIFRPLHNYLVPDRFKSRSKNLFKTFKDTTKILKKPYFFIQMNLLTIIWWTVLFMRPYILALGLGLYIHPIYFIFAMPVVMMIEIIPISLLGIGTRDAGLIAVFSILGVGAETMVAISLMMLVLSILPQVFLGYLIAFKKGVSLNLFTKDEKHGEKYGKD